MTLCHTEERETDRFAISMPREKAKLYYGRYRAAVALKLMTAQHAGQSMATQQLIHCEAAEARE